MKIFTFAILLFVFLGLSAVGSAALLAQIYFVAALAMVGMVIAVVAMGVVLE